MNKKIMKHPQHLDRKMNGLKTGSIVHSNKSASARSDLCRASLSQRLSVKNKPSRLNQIEQTKKKRLHQRNSHQNGTVKNIRSGDNLKTTVQKFRPQKPVKHNIEIDTEKRTQTKPQKPTERKQNIEMKAEIKTSKQLSKQTSLPAVKQVQDVILKKDSNGSPMDTSVSIVKNDETSNKKIHKRKSNSRKLQDGASNWMKLCATLHIDASVRKAKPVKRPASDSNTEQAEPKRAKPGVWFDNVDKILIETDHVEKGTAAVQTSSSIGGTSVAEHDTSSRLVKSESFKGVTNCVAIDCEMVGIGPHGEESILARVSVVNHFGVCLYDKFVLPREKVTDYRTFVSGVTAENLATGEEFTKVQAEVSGLIRGRILVGHAVHNDLKVLFLTHPHKMIRDTSRYKPFRELFSGRLPSLKKLTEKVLGVHVQEGQHSSIQDAQATMRLYTMYRQKWEKELRKERKTDRRQKKKKKEH